MSEPRISLYEHENTSGRTLEVESATANLFDKGFDNKCSSIVVHSGVWELFQHSDYDGKKWIVWEGQDYNESSKWGGKNEVISSLRPVKVEIASRSGCKVYQHRHNTGRCIELWEPVQNFSDYRFNNRISSITVLRGTWVAYTYANFQGNQLLLPEGNHNIPDIRSWNNTISSMRPIEIDFPTELIALEYDISAAVINNTPKTLQTWTQVNNTDLDQSVIYTEEHSVTVTNTSQFRMSTTVTVEISAGVSFDVLRFVNGNIETKVSSSFTKERINGKETSETKTWEVKVPSKIPPHSKVTMKCIITEGKAEVPFRALLEKGDRRWYERGFWYGVENFNFRTEFNQEDIH